MKYLHILFLVIFGIYQGNAQKDTVMVRDLSAAWVSFDENGELQQTRDLTKLNAGGLFLLRQEVEGKLLKLCGENFDFWINGGLIQTDVSDCLLYDLSSESFSNKGDTLFLVVISDQFEKVSSQLFEVTSGDLRRFDLPKRRIYSLTRSGTLTLLVIIVFLTGLKISQKNAISSLFSLSFLSPSSDGSTDWSAVASVLSGAFVAFSIVWAEVHMDLEGLRVLSFFKRIGVVTILLTSKYIIVNLASKLFGYKKIHWFQLQSFVLSMSLFYLIVFVSQVISSWFNFSNQWLEISLPYLFLTTNIIYMYWLYRIFIERYSRQKLHLIVYLCTTEIFPTFILVNWILN